MSQGTIDGPKIFVGDREVTNLEILRRFKYASSRLDSTVYSLNSNESLKIKKDTLISFDKLKAFQTMLNNKEFLGSVDNLSTWCNK